MMFGVLFLARSSFRLLLSAMAQRNRHKNGDIEPILADCDNAAGNGGLFHFRNSNSTESVKQALQPIFFHHLESL